MKIEINDCQIEELKKQVREEMIDKLKKQKTFKYWFVRSIGFVAFAGFMFLMLWGFSVLVANDGYSNADNFDSCWLEKGVKGIDTKTGKEAEKQFHINCDRFEEINK